MSSRRTSSCALMAVVLSACVAVPSVPPTPAGAGTTIEPTSAPATMPEPGSPTPSPSPVRTPAPTAAPSAPPSEAPSPPALRLDWVRGRLPKGLTLCEDGCHQPWDAWPVFGGLAIGFGTGNRWAETVRLRWTADGTHWETLAVPPGLFKDWSAIFSDGSATGAFAAVYRSGRGRLWRTVDRGRTWREVTGIANWPDLETIEPGAGRFLAVADVVDGPARMFVSDDGWSWAEVTPLDANLIGDAPADWLSIGLSGDAAGFVATVSDLDTDEPSWFTTSADGRAWTEPSSKPFSGTECGDVSRVPSGYLCFSNVDSDELATRIWASPDGTHWRTIGYHEGVELLPEGDFIASSWVYDDDREAYSYSVDGVTWSSPAISPNGAYFELRSGRTLFLWEKKLWSARLPDPPDDAVPLRRPT